MRCLWEVMREDSDVIETLAEVLELRYEGSCLLVCESAMETCDIVGLVVSILLALLGFRTFSGSRWLSVDRSARAMVLAYLAGLSGLVSFAMDKPSVSKFYLNGYTRLSEDRRLFLVQAALCSLIPDAALSMVCLLYTSPSPRDKRQSRMPSSA